MSHQSQFTDVPAGKIAAIVTHLEMRSPPDMDAGAPSLPGELRRINSPNPDWYFEVYKRIGADLLWFSRLTIPWDTLASKLSDPDYAVYALSSNNQDEGLVELDFRQPKECELTCFGVSQNLVGSGAGYTLMQHAIRIAWSHPIERFWLHTCTLDHPRALPFYLRNGFSAYKRQVEIADDPRLTGALPRDAAPQVPIVE